MRIYSLLLIAFCILANTAKSQPADRLRIEGFPPTLPVSIAGSAWYIYLNGTIDADAPKRLASYLEARKVPYGSHVVLNSEGGSLLAGIELGRIFRKYGLNTDVGIRNSQTKQRYNISPGICFSACAIAYVGGRFRYLKDQSRYGVHRFAFTKRGERDEEIAQVVSAAIVSYLREMNIDPDLFSLSTRAGFDEINEPSRKELERLNVINNGFPEPIWSIESIGGMLYLKGERDTSFGMNKFIVYCDGGRLFLHVIFDPQGRQQEVMLFRGHSLVIDGALFPITPLERTIENGWFNITYDLKPKEVARLRKASTVGFTSQLIYGAPVFLGFDSMPFALGRDKFAGIANSCRR